MIDQSILSTLNDLELKKNRLSLDLNQVCESQHHILEQISELHDQEDVGYDLFSPRNNISGIHNQIISLHSELSQLQLQEKQLRSQIEYITAQIEQLHHVISTDSLSSDLVLTVFSSEYVRSDYQTILSRLLHIQDVLHQDPDQASIEIDNLIYYLKALLTESDGQT